ncbi:hypothetical protein [uncultured Tenacibaculum sp.]|uniref:hypothetical protein n=1 Tax=uncultured Tenacibaculum sp. TaxID=174713 RepID=UPI002603CEC0|nr:hypothetical protein [uncultured Tenacibaculum sp.]
MKEKRPIDKKRESAGMADIGTKEDGAIVEMIKIGDRLIVLKEKSIYEFIMADTIDPKRTNIKLPNNIHKLIIEKGSESEIVSRVFLTAKTLFKKGNFDEAINLEKALTLSLDILLEMEILENEIESYLQKEQEVSDEYESKRDKPVSYSIPSIGNAKNRCTTIFQKADHIEQTLMKIINIFYPNEGLTQQSHFPKFYDIIKAKYGEDNEFAKFLLSILEFMKLIRNLRNALDHQLKGVEIYDFELKPNSDILAPSIELDFKGSKLERQSLSEFLEVLIPNFVMIFEVTIAHLANQNFKPSLMAHGIRLIPEEKRWNKFVKYSFWAPLGVGGYFDQ